MTTWPWRIHPNDAGMGATVLVEKIAGAAAEAGMPLEKVADLADQVTQHARSMGVALSSCTSPNIGFPTFELPLDKIELGVGIHGERGRHRMPLATADAMTDMILEPIVQDLKLQPNDHVLALISGLGGTPLQELYIVYRHLYHALARNDIRIERRLIGNYVTSLDMAGCAITLLVLTPELLKLWDAPVQTPALSW